MHAVPQKIFTTTYRTSLSYNKRTLHFLLFWGAVRRLSKIIRRLLVIIIVDIVGHNYLSRRL